MLSKADGMACSKCGCTAGQRIRSVVHYGAVCHEWLCDYCGYRWYEIDAEVAEKSRLFARLTPSQGPGQGPTEIYVRKVRCRIQSCNSRNTYCYGTHGVRYFICLTCGHKFTQEIQPDEKRP
jgi:hypothetical protein